MFKELENQARVEGINRLCVRAMIINDNKILLIQRALHDSLPGIYELPGGSVDLNETLDIALRREIKEETGLIINEIGPYLGFFDYKSKKSNILTRQFSFVTKIYDTSKIIISIDHCDYQWIQLELIRSIDLPINEKVFSLIDEYKKII